MDIVNKLVVVLVLIVSACATANPPPQKVEDKIVYGDPVSLSRNQILPHWGPTAKTIQYSVQIKCFAIAHEALTQLQEFHAVLEIAKKTVDADDPIAKGHADRTKELKELGKAVGEMPHTNEGCPPTPPKPKGNIST